ncbi:MAG TPA: hypothetical protein VH542_03975 [Steroidobacteraceae bacterium]|jgi:hypothetical protein
MIHQLRSGLLAGLCALAACTTMGTGTGHEGGSDHPVAFSWTSKDAVSGTMSATLANDKTYTGPFFQITSETRVETLTPLWFGWRRGWYDWPYWGRYSAPEFATRYSGKVVANLNGPNGDHMRCRFHLMRPASGMSGGGSGECQETDGETIEATFPAA